MSPLFRNRAAASWTDYLHSNLTEAADRHHDAHYDFDGYLRLRRRSCGGLPSVDFGERAAHAEVPPSAWHSGLLGELRAITVDIIVHTNELVSVEADLARGDTNLTDYLMHERHLSRDDAIEELRGICQAQIARFTARQDDVPLLCDRLDLSVDDRQAVHAHLRCLRAWIRGDWEWQRTAGRYTSQAVHIIATSGTGLLNTADLATAPPSE